MSGSGDRQSAVLYLGALGSTVGGVVYRAAIEQGSHAMPSKGKVQLNVLLTERVDTRIRVVAEVDGDSVSVAVEKAVTAYVEERAADPEWRTKHQAWKQDQQEKIRAL